MLAPSALYPDALLAQVLMASTYPLEIVSAARWVQVNPKVSGDALEDAMRKQPQPGEPCKEWNDAFGAMVDFTGTYGEGRFQAEIPGWIRYLGTFISCNCEDQFVSLHMLGFAYILSHFI